MTAATNYTENNVINAMLRGVAFPLPTGTYVSLHTADPGETGANSEVQIANWPSYVRKRTEGAGAIGTGWTAASDGVSSNANQVVYPNNNGAGPVTITHWAVWDALTGGNCLVKAAATTPRTLEPGDVLVFDVGTLVVTQA